jgi:hypothetical protein
VASFAADDDDVDDGGADVDDVVDVEVDDADDADAFFGGVASALSDSVEIGVVTATARTLGNRAAYGK